MKKIVALTACTSSALTMLAVWCAGWASLPTQVKLENAKVKVVEITSPPGAPRERHVRDADQVIVFLDDSRYPTISLKRVLPLLEQTTDPYRRETSWLLA